VEDMCLYETGGDDVVFEYFLTVGELPHNDVGL